jgi:hypothetical protein
VREEIVFALSQLEDTADEALIAVVRGDFSRAVKKQARSGWGSTDRRRRWRILMRR